MSRGVAYALGVTGLVVMVVASLWAPAQPELWQGGGACEVAPCGTLEDPARWRAAWGVWAAGFAMLVVSVSVVARPARPRPAWVALVVLTAPLGLLGLGFIASVVSLSTSVHGAATVGACGLVAPVLAVVAGAARRAAQAARH